MKPARLGVLVVAIVLVSGGVADKTYAAEAADLNRLADSHQMTMSGGLHGVNQREVGQFKRRPASPGSISTPVP